MLLYIHVHVHMQKHMYTYMFCELLIFIRCSPYIQYVKKAADDNRVVPSLAVAAERQMISY